MGKGHLNEMYDEQFPIVAPQNAIPDMVADVAIWAFAKSYERADDSGTKHESDTDWFLTLGADWVASPDTSDALRLIIEKHLRNWEKGAQPHE